MTIQNNSLGGFTFIRINRPGDTSGAPVGLSRETKTVERFNVPGSGVILGAKKGMQFQMESFVDADTTDEAHDLAKSYRDSIGSDPKTLVFQGRDWSAAEETDFVVLNVTNIRVRAIGAASGGHSTSKGAGLWAIWDLIGVPQ